VAVLVGSVIIEIIDFFMKASRHIKYLLCSQNWIFLS